MKNIKNNNVLGEDLEKYSNDPLTVYITDRTNSHISYRSIPVGLIEKRKKVEMEFLEKEKKFVSEEVYKVQPNPTKT